MLKSLENKVCYMVTKTQFIFFCFRTALVSHRNHPPKKIQVNPSQYRFRPTKSPLMFAFDNLLGFFQQNSIFMYLGAVKTYHNTNSKETHRHLLLDNAYIWQLVCAI